MDDDEEAEEEVLVNDLSGHMDDVFELPKAAAVPEVHLLHLGQIAPVPASLNWPKLGSVLKTTRSQGL